MTIEDDFLREELQKFNAAILPWFRAQGMHYLVFLYPYPAAMIKHVSSEGRKQIEKRCTQALQKTFHDSLQEINERGELAQVNSPRKRT